MNKNKVKKSIEYKSINSILKTSTFVGFFCVQNVSVKDKLSVKESLSDSGFKYKVIKSNLLSKHLLGLVPNLDFLVSGSLAICYSTKNISKHTEDLLFTNMQKVFKLLKKNKNTILLGNLFNTSLNNVLFEKKVSSLKSLSATHIESLAYLSKPKNELSLILDKKKDN
jgi:ribosomal protein L10|tara:strand:- start:1109 stop:1612 length:504 start_codon:yes stop_codon:yes gene_type:complete